MGGLPEDMCTAQHPFEYGDIQQNRVDKTFKQIEGFNRLAPDVNIADITPDRPTAILQKARKDFFLLLRCSGFFNLDMSGKKFNMPMTDAGWQNAFFDQHEAFNVPVFNYVRLRAILEAVKSLDAGSTLPIVIGEHRERLGNMYVLDLAAEPMDVDVGNQRSRCIGRKRPNQRARSKSSRITRRSTHRA